MRRFYVPSIVTEHDALIINRLLTRCAAIGELIGQRVYTDQQICRRFLLLEGP